jgi:hypothetical protein
MKKMGLAEFDQLPYNDQRKLLQSRPLNDLLTYVHPALSGTQRMLESSASVPQLLGTIAEHSSARETANLMQLLAPAGVIEPHEGFKARQLSSAYSNSWVNKALSKSTTHARRIRSSSALNLHRWGLSVSPGKPKTPEVQVGLHLDDEKQATTTAEHAREYAREYSRSMSGGRSGLRDYQSKYKLSLVSTEKSHERERQQYRPAIPRASLSLRDKEPQLVSSASTPEFGVGAAFFNTSPVKAGPRGGGGGGGIGSRPQSDLSSRPAWGHTPMMLTASSRLLHQPPRLPAIKSAKHKPLQVIIPSDSNKRDGGNGFFLTAV